MLSREAITREALSELEAQRARNLNTERARKVEAGEKNPEIARLLQKRQQLLFASMRSAFAKPGQAQDISASIKMQMQEMNEALRRELISCGYPEDYLQPVYRCVQCRDTGYVGEPVHEQCTCLKRAVMNRLYQNEGLQGLERENFAAFNELVFPDEAIEGRKHTQRGYICKIREICEAYADAFEPGAGKGLLLSGKSGLGKTFLMNCVAQRVLERGYSVVVISAYKLMEIMRRYQFNGDAVERVEDMLSCDLLCIDDLGSEPMVRGVTMSALYHIINERRSANRALVVTTNCSAEQLYDVYEDRIAARLTDQTRMRGIPFIGQDVRQYTGK